jgi:cardiolipin synthase
MWEDIQNNVWFYLLVINYVIVLVTAVFIIGSNRNPVSTLSYILSMLIFPFVGLLIYYFIGREYRKQKMFERKGVFDDKTIKKWEKKLLLSEEKLDEYESKFLDEKIKQVKLLQNNQKKPLTFKNEAKILINGEAKFERLFVDIKKAKHHIHAEYYIFNSEDEIGKKFIELLCKKAREGVEVRVSYDYVASEVTNSACHKMRECGIEIYSFMPVRFPNLTRRLNYRNHRKIVVIDGKTGYVGGINVCDEYVNPTKNGRYWRDTHIRLEGNSVKSLQTHFLLNWNFVSDSEIEIKDEYFPSVKSRGDKAVQIAASGPDSDFPNIMESLFSAINSAEKYIYITTPYFVPNDQILTALKTASRSGVKVKLIIPRQSDMFILKYASESYMQDLLESGIEVYHYCKGMIHAKTMVIDDLYSTIGTCNMDYRSFEINFEINAIVYNEETAKEMVEAFNKDIEDCDPMDYERWLKRSAWKKWKESFFRLWAPLL